MFEAGAINSLVAVKIRHAVIAGGRAVEVIEPLASREQVHEETRLCMFRKIPLSETRCGIPFGFQDFGDCNFVLVQNGMDLLDVAPLGDAQRITASHQRRSGWPANRLSVEARELHALLRHRIKPRSSDVRRTKTANVLISLVVGEDDDEVGSDTVGSKRCKRP